MVNAINAVNNALSSTIITLNVDAEEDFTATESFYFEEGDIIDAVMVFSKENNKEIKASYDMDELDFMIVNSDTQDIWEGSWSVNQNVESFEFEIPETGNYEFWIENVYLADTNLPPQCAIAFNVK